MAMLAVKRNGLADQVIERMRALIADKTYLVGERLPPEAELCAMFGVGRSTLREAMRVLANRGLVDVRHGEGTFVVAEGVRETFEERVGRAALADIYEARLLLELPLSELAAERRTSRDVSAMRTSLKKRNAALEAGDVRRYIEFDFAFHLAVATATKNRALYDIYESFVGAVRPMIEAAVTAEYIIEEQDTLHGELCNAIADGDVVETRRLVRSHLLRSLRGISTGLA